MSTTATKAKTVSIGNWVLSLILLGIPLVNIIMLFVWAFGDGNPNKKNFAIASLILFAVSIVISALAFSTVVPLIMQEMDKVQAIAR